MNELSITATAGGGVRVAIRVMPRSPRTAIEGVRGGRLVVRVTAPPVDDAANAAVLEALAAALALPKRAIHIASGATARNKIIEIAGATPSEIRAQLETHYRT